MVVTNAGQLSFTELYLPKRTHSQLLVGDLLTDRALYRAGEAVHVKGYIQVYNDAGAMLPVAEYRTASALTLEVDWGANRSILAVDVDGTFGSFAHTLPIPGDAQHGPKSLILSASGPGSGPTARRVHVSAAPLTIADPRIPTGVLEVSTPAQIYRPGDAMVPLSIATRTYTGVAARGTTVTLRWSVGTHAGETPVQLPDGVVEHPFRCPPDIVRSAAKVRETLTIAVEWLTASRDLLQRRVTVRVAESLWQGTLAVPAGPENVLPGFPAKAELRLVIAGPTAVAPSNPPEVEMRFAAEDATEHAAFYAAATATGTDVQFQWDAAGPAAADAVVTAVATFAVPAMGRYRVVARYRDDAGVAQYAAVTVGRTARQWRHRPLVDWRPLEPLEVVGVDYAAGARATLRWVCPFPAAQALVQWGGGHAPPGHAVLELVHGPNLLNFTLGAECARGCEAVVSVVTPAQTPVILPVPISQMLDTALPLHLSLGPVAVPIAAPNRTAAVAVEAPAEVLPGATAEVALTLPLEAGARGEAAVWVVDQALLDLAPSPLPAALAVQRPLRVRGGLAAQSVHDRLASAETVRRAFNLTRQRLMRDPWVPGGSWQPRPLAGLDQDTDTYLDCVYGQLTPFPPAAVGLHTDPCGTHMPLHSEFASVGLAAMAAPGMAMGPAVTGRGFGEGAPAARDAEGDAVTRDAAGAGPAPAALLRSDFKATALFVGRVPLDASGRARVRVPVPDNIGTWVVRAVGVAVERDGVARRFGYAEAAVVARRPLSLLASMPRVVRVGDRFRAGCTVTARRDGPVTVRARFAGSSALQFVGPAERSVSVKAHAPEEVVFELRSVAVGATTVQYEAVQGQASDAFQHDVPSLGLQGPVSMATSFAIAATLAPVPWKERMRFPEAVPGSGTVTVVAGVGRLPAVQAAGEGVGRQVNASLADRGYAYATDLLSAAVVPQVYERYAMAAGTAVLERARALQGRALRALVEHSLPGTGLLELPHSRMRYPWASLPLNIYGVFVWARLREAGGGAAPVFPSEYEAHVKDWETAVWQELEEIRGRARGDGRYLWGTLAEVHFAYGARGPPPRTGRSDFALATTVQHVDRLNDLQKAMLVLTVCERQERARYQACPPPPLLLWPSPRLCALVRVTAVFS